MAKSTSKPALIEKEHAGKKDYLAIPAKELIEAFGKGMHIPGSGSASALSGLLAVQLLKTVLTLSISKKEYSKFKTGFEVILHKLIVEDGPKFTEYFNDDIRVFHQVSYHRRLRDKATTAQTKAKHKTLALETLKEATDIPLSICETSLDLMQTAFGVFDNGFKGARGDSGVAISNLLSASQGALFIVFLNLKSIARGKWKEERLKKAVNLAIRFTTLQKDAYSRVVTLFNENKDVEQLALSLPNI